jgi:serine protease Do
MEDQSNLKLSTENSDLPSDIQTVDIQVPKKKSLLANGMRPLTFLLLGFFLAVSLLVKSPSKTYIHAQQDLPKVVAPMGQLAEVFENSRPAALQIEARSSSRGYVGAPIGIGTGFFISEDGYALTAYHVVDSSDLPVSLRHTIQYVGVSPDKTEYELTIVGFDAYFDLALLKAEVKESVAFLPLATNKLKVRDSIVAIGNSRGDFLAARAGEVSRLGVDRPKARFADQTIELTAALAPGDSGGPILNKQGEAVGVVSFISFAPDALASETYVAPFLLNRTRDFAAYAIPISFDSELIAELKTGAKNDIPVIGFSAPSSPSGIPQNYTPLETSLRLGRKAGAIVFDVRPGGPADLAGIKGIEVSKDGEVTSADVIVAVNDEPTPTFDDLIETLYVKKVGDTVTVTVQRGKQTFKVRVELGARNQVFN